MHYLKLQLPVSERQKDHNGVPLAYYKLCVLYYSRSW